MKSVINKVHVYIETKRTQINQIHLELVRKTKLNISLSI